MARTNQETDAEEDDTEEDEAEDNDAMDPAAEFVTNFNEDDFEVDADTGDLLYTFPVPPNGEYKTVDEISDALRDFAVRHGYAVGTRRSVTGKSKTWKCDR